MGLRKPFRVKKSTAVKDLWNVVRRSDSEIVEVKTSKKAAKQVAKKRNRRAK